MAEISNGEVVLALTLSEGRRWDPSVGSATMNYLMRGWRSGTADYETWIAVGAPNSSNPSGQPITDITIQASWSS